MSLRRKDQGLLERFLDGEATPAEAQDLAQRMRCNPELRLNLEQLQAIEEQGQALIEIEPRRDIVALAERQWARETSRPARREAPVRRWWLAFGAGTAAVAAAVAMLVLFRPANMPQEGLASTPGRWVITVLNGSAWVQQGGVRRQAAVGDLLKDGDGVETDEGAAVRLVIGAEKTQVALDESTRVGVLGAASSSSEIMIDRGALRAAVERTTGGLPLRVHLRGSLDSVELTNGRVGLLNDGNGSSVLACEDGDAVVRTKIGGFHVAGGYEVQSRSGEWIQPRPIVESLSLDVRPDRRGRGSDGTFLLEGRTNPGAQVVVNGNTVKVAEDGSFAYRVVLGKEPTRLLVSARDALLRKKSAELVAARSVSDDAPSKPAAPASKGSEWDLGWESPG
jgi:hypothetical protein